jgi:diacylglycerol kinase
LARVGKDVGAAAVLIAALTAAAIGLLVLGPLLLARLSGS